MKRLLCVLFSICLLCFSGCSSSSDSRDGISKTIGIDISSADYLTRIDTHGGFHGDGCTYISAPLAAADCLSQIEENWNTLPLTENLTAVVYGLQSENTTIGPYICFDDSGSSGVPQITNGYYFFLDRHSQSRDPHDDSSILSRGSFNLTIAIYDCDTEMLYYLELDT